MTMAQDNTDGQTNHGIIYILSRNCIYKCMFYICDVYFQPLHQEEKLFSPWPQQKTWLLKAHVGLIQKERPDQTGITRRLRQVTVGYGRLLETFEDQVNVCENWPHSHQCIHFLDTFETCPRLRLRQVTPGYGGSRWVTTKT